MIDERRLGTNRPTFMSADGLPIRKRLYHDIPPWVEDESLFFLTINCAERGRRQLTELPASNGLLEAARFYHERRKWNLTSCSCGIISMGF